MGVIVLAAGAAASLVGLLRTRNRAWLVPALVFAALAIAAFFTASWWIYAGIVVVGFLAVAAVVRSYAGRGVGLPVAGGSLVTAAMLTVGVVALMGAGGSAPASATNTPDEGTIKALTVTTATYKCAVDSNGLVAYDVDALKKVGGKDGRKWSDAIALPITATDPVKALAEVQSAICEDPLNGAHVAHYFSNLKLGSGSNAFAVASVNPWLNEFKGDADEVIHRRAASYITLLDVENPSETQVAEAVKQNRAWQAIAGKLNTLLGKFLVGEIKAEQQSVLNYHLLGGGLAAGSLPAIGLNDKQEDLPALQLYLTQKDQSECVVRIGFNMGDKRLEQFSCATPPEPTPTTSTPGTSKTTPPGDTPSSPPPGCKENCQPSSPPPGCEENCQPGGKNPEEDPGPQGNAPEGSGRNEDPGPGEEKPYNPPPKDLYTPPAPPVNNGPPAGSDPVDEDPPPAEPSVNPTNGDPNEGDPGGW